MPIRQALGQISGNLGPSFLRDRNPRKLGPKPKAIADQIYTLQAARKRTKICYSTKTKIARLMIKEHHKILIRNEYSRAILRYRVPTNKEIRIHFGGPQRPIPPNTIQSWQDYEKMILSIGHNARRLETTFLCHWLELKNELLEMFKRERAKGKAIRRSWFLRKVKEIWIQ